MRERRRFQQGGLSALADETDDELDDEMGPPEPGRGGGATQSLVELLTRSTADEEQYIRDQMSSAERTKQALINARKRLSEQEYNPGEALLAVGAGLGRGTRSGSLGESIGNAAGALSQYANQRGEFERGRDKDMLELDIGIAQAEDPVLKAQFELAKLKRAQAIRMLTLGGHGGRPAELQLWDELTKNLTPAQIDSAARRKLGLESRAGNFVMRMVGNVPTLVGVGMEDDAEHPEGVQIPLTSLVQELNSQGAKAGATEIGKGLGEQYNKLQELIVPSQTKIARLDRLTGLLEGVDTGKLTPLEMKATGVLDYFGIELDPNLGAKQASQAITSELALQNRNPSGGAGMPGSMSDADREFLKQMGPELSQTPEGRRLIIESSLKLAQRDLDIAKLARAYKQKHGAFDEFFYDELQTWADAHPLFGPAPNQPKRVDQLNPAQKAELDQLMQQQSQPPVARARGGSVRRRYQTGGRVVTLSDGTKVDLDAQAPAEETATPPTDEKPGSLLDLESIAQGLGIGAAGVAGAGAGVGLEALATRIAPNPLTRPERTVVNEMQDQEVDPLVAIENLKKSRRLGVPATLMDEPGARVTAERALTFASPTGAKSALDAMQSRHDAGRERASAQVNKGLKPYDYFDHLEKLTENLYTNAKPLYEEAYRLGENSIKETPEIRSLLETKEGKRAVQYAVDLMQLEGQPIGKADALGMVSKPSLRFLDLVKRGFDQQIGTEEKGGPTDYGRALRGARKKYVTLLDAAAPQEYRDARAQYAGDLEVRDALEEGRVFHKFQPEELKSREESMSFAERNAFRTGMAQRLYEVINAPSTDMEAARRLVKSPATLARLEPFFDSSREFTIFKEALNQEVELHDSGEKLIREGESRRMQERRKDVGALRTAAEEAPNRASWSPLRWAMSLVNERPLMGEKEADEVLKVLRRGSIPEMNDLAARVTRGVRKPGYRTPRRLAAAALGAGAAALGAHELMDDE